ncbi:hypothetical protein LI82_12100 [Methanococcoides methylutens]|uniref:Uncharacterized protein n=1 Tax=Methanococcoides methylutens TaxID=2226 RepID=A0A099T0F1_METMT|nr:hypothetical protein [Methanococcoides methylutens]KGK98434.1 hypothetical protein LI82_12100 [Methanococcoides methylutens]
MSGTGTEPAFEASIEMNEEDFEFATPPMSKEFVIQTFEKYDLRHIVLFGEDMFYVSQQDMEPFHPLYVKSSYPDDIELIFDFMTIERIHKIEYIEGVLKRSPIEEHPDI